MNNEKKWYWLYIVTNEASVFACELSDDEKKTIDSMIKNKITIIDEGFEGRIYISEIGYSTKEEAETEVKRIWPYLFDNDVYVW